MRLNSTWFIYSKIWNSVLSVEYGKYIHKLHIAFLHTGKCDRSTDTPLLAVSVSEKFFSRYGKEIKYSRGNTNYRDHGDVGAIRDSSYVHKRKRTVTHHLGEVHTYLRCTNAGGCVCYRNGTGIEGGSVQRRLPLLRKCTSVKCKSVDLFSGKVLRVSKSFSISIEEKGTVIDQRHVCIWLFALYI